MKIPSLLSLVLNKSVAPKGPPVKPLAPSPSAPSVGRIGSPRVRLPLVGPEDWEAAKIEDELALVSGIEGVDFRNFRPDRNAAAGGALPRVHGTTR